MKVVITLSNLFSENALVLIPGLNWLVCAIHIKLPWYERKWALPVLTILMPPEIPLSSSQNAHDLKKTKQHKTLTQWTCQAVKLLRRWLGPTIKITCILALFSLINLMAIESLESKHEEIPIQTSSWYKKSHVTFSDVLAYVRRQILKKKYFSYFDKNTELWKYELEEIMNQMSAA